MNRIDQMVAKLLLNANVIGREQLQVLKDHIAQYGGSFHKRAAELGMVPEEPLVTALASALNLPLVNLDKMQIDPRSLEKLPGEFCMQQVVFPCAIRDKGQSLWLAMADPTDEEAKKTARLLSGMNLIRPLVGRASEIKDFIRHHYRIEEMQEVDPFGAGIDLSLSEAEEEEEFKVVSVMGGNTLVKHVGGVKIDATAGPVGQEVPAPQARPERPGPSARQLAAFARIGENQQKATLIITKLTRLLIDKGLFSAEDFNQMLKK